MRAPPRRRRPGSHSGLTQRALAFAAGVDFTYLPKIENGRLEHLPSVKMIRQLAAALHVDELD